MLIACAALGVEIVIRLLIKAYQNSGQLFGLVCSKVASSYKRLSLQ
jgi:hypothetical protein